MRNKEEIATAFSDPGQLDGAEAFFLVGVGGAGMSALARMLAKRRYSVRGSDAGESPEIERLRIEGIEVVAGHRPDVLNAGEVLILSDAIDLKRSPEVFQAHKLDAPIVRRSQALGWLLRKYKVIAVTGTHGKTTTTAMLGCSLAAAGMDPLVVVGASIPAWGGPVLEGEGPFAVIEACEAYDSFHDLYPYMVVLTNLELDHVDFHGTYENLRNSVVRFVDKIPPNGWLVYCSEDRGASEVAELTDASAIPYGASEEWQRLVSNKVGLVGDLPTFPQGNSLMVPGRHNLLNAAGAMTAAALVRADLDKVEEALRTFGGAERRLQVLQEGSAGTPGHDLGGVKEAGPLATPGHAGSATDPGGVEELSPGSKTRGVADNASGPRRGPRNVTVIDDYAHHPSEILASIAALRERYFSGKTNAKRLVVVFQPHLYSRTAPLINEFAEALSHADEVVITDIYPAREDPLPGISSALIAEQITVPIAYIPSRHLLPRYVAARAQDGDVIVGMGAGTIGEFAPALVRELRRRSDLDSGTRRLRVAVLYGGDSAEREVSIHSGREIHAALRRLGYDSRIIDVSDLLLSQGEVHPLASEVRPDLAFLAVHGTNGEDGAIQGLLELLHIPYTGSGILASAICMDKALTKQILAENGIKVPAGTLLTSPDSIESLPSRKSGTQHSYIVKPNAQGSTVGLSFVEKKDELCPAVKKAFAYGDTILVEEWLKGIEISTPVVGGVPLIPVEIVPKSGKYDFASKYQPGGTEEICPARIAPNLLEEAKSIALKAHTVLRCQGATRTDAIVCGEDIYVLEVNTLPGMTQTSLLPNSAAVAGISFDELCKMLVEEALQNHEAKAQAR